MSTSYDPPKPGDGPFCKTDEYDLVSHIRQKHAGHEAELIATLIFQIRELKRHLKTE